MRNIIATFTEGERNIIVFVFVSLAVGCGILEWRESQQSRLVFTAPETVTHVPEAQLAVMPKGMDAEGRVDLNTADIPVLETLPGIGPALASAISRHRDTNGPFRSMADLDAVPGIGPAMMTKLAPLVSFEGQVASASLAVAVAPAVGGGALQVQSVGGRVNINTATAEQLDALVGVGPALAQRIIQDRQLQGPFTAPTDLDRVKGIGPSILQKNAALIAVD